MYQNPFITHEITIRLCYIIQIKIVFKDMRNKINFHACASVSDIIQFTLGFIPKLKYLS